MPCTFRLRQGLLIRISRQGEHSIEKRLPNGTLQVKNLASDKCSSITEEQIIKMWCDGTLEILSDVQGMSFTQQRLTKHVASELSLVDEVTRIEVKRRFSYISIITNRRLNKLAKSTLLSIISEGSMSTQDTSPPSPITLYRWYKRYIKSGEDLMALAPAYKRRGNSKRKLIIGDSQRSTDAARIIDEVIAEKYLSRERPTISEVHKIITDRIATTNKFREIDERLSVPHLNTIYKTARKLDPYIVMKARYGQRLADQKYRPIRHAKQPTHPLERVEIDHTKLDLMVVDPVMRLPIGRPWLTTALDKFSRMILGKYMSFNPPSYLSVMHCLRHAITPKTYINDKFPNITNTWEAYGVPELIVVDNAVEFHSRHFEDSCLQMGIVIQYAPPKKASYKGAQERWYSTQNKQLLHRQPGTTFSNIFDLADYDPKANAVISVAALEEMSHIFIVDIYHQQEHRGIRDIPSRLWQEGIAEYPPALPPDRAALDVLLGCIERRCISAKGIELHGGGLFYNDDALASLRRRLKPSEQVTLKYDPSDLSAIHVADLERGIYILVPAVNQEYAQGLSLWQHKVIKSYARQRIQEKVDVVALSRAKRQIQEVVEREWLTAKRTSSRGKLARMKSHGDGKQILVRGFNSSQDQLNLVDSNPLRVAARSGTNNSNTKAPSSTAPTSIHNKTKVQTSNDVESVTEEIGDIDLTGWDADYDLPM